MAKNQQQPVKRNISVTVETLPKFASRHKVNAGNALADNSLKNSTNSVVFVSRFYKRKLWTNHERESAQARAFKSRTEYILPVRFDDTEIPGIRPTQGYIDLRTTTPEQLADMLLEKLGLRDEIQEMIKYLEGWLGDYKITVIGTDLHFKSSVEKMIGDSGERDFEADFPIRLMLEMYRLGEMEHMFLMPAIVPW
jgi:hypothetical protein